MTERLHFHTSLSLFTFMHWRRKWQPTPVFLPGESQGWRSLVGCRLWVAQGRTRLKPLSSSSSVIARTWKRPKCSLTVEWIKKMWYIYVMEYYLAIKRKEIGSLVETWMDPESVIQSEGKLKEKNEYMLTYTCWI